MENQNTTTLADSIMPMTIYANYNYRDPLRRYFNRAFFSDSLDFSFNKKDSEIYSSTLVAKIKTDIFNPECMDIECLGVKIHPSIFHPILSHFNISKTEKDTEEVLGLLSQRKFKILGNYFDTSIADKARERYVSLTFEKLGSNYNIFDNGKLFEGTIGKYWKDKTFFKP